MTMINNRLSQHFWRNVRETVHSMLQTHAMLQIAHRDNLSFVTTCSIRIIFDGNGDANKIIPLSCLKLLYRHLVVDGNVYSYSVYIVHCVYTTIVKQLETGSTGLRITDMQ